MELLSLVQWFCSGSHLWASHTHTHLVIGCPILTEHKQLWTCPLPVVAGKWRHQLPPCSSQSYFHLFFFKYNCFKKKKFMYLVGPGLSCSMRVLFQLQNVGSSSPNSDRTPGPLHWELSLSHWTTREVPSFTFSFTTFLLISDHLHISNSNDLLRLNTKSTYSKSFPQDTYLKLPFRPKCPCTMLPCCCYLVARSCPTLHNPVQSQSSVPRVWDQSVQNPTRENSCQVI